MHLSVNDYNTKVSESCPFSQISSCLFPQQAFSREYLFHLAIDIISIGHKRFGGNVCISR